MNDWDGIDRRRPINNVADSGNGSVNVSMAVLIIGFAAVVVLQVASMFGHSILSNTQEKEHVNAEAFRTQITCFVVGTTQGKSGTDLLTTCGFLRLGGK